MDDLVFKANMQKHSAVSSMRKNVSQLNFIFEIVNAEHGRICNLNFKVLFLPSSFHLELYLLI